MKALIIVDMQNDFMPGGPLPTKGADALVPLINQLMEKYPVVLATKDWHPKNHTSFAANHLGKKVGERMQIGEVDQILWPVHCVQNTDGAEFTPGLNEEKIDEIFYKGTDPLVDSYSTFFDNAHQRKTGLEDYLKSHKIKDVVFVGVATDYCVLDSVRHAIELGFNVEVVVSGCRAINLKPEDEQLALDEMVKMGARLI